MMKSIDEIAEKVAGRFDGGAYIKEFREALKDGGYTVVPTAELERLREVALELVAVTEESSERDSE